MFLSIDPGINNCGISVNDPVNRLQILETINVKNARKFTDDEKIVEQQYGNRAVKVLHILNTINSLLVKYPSINTIVAEAPFYNALTPVAYGSLLEVIFSIKYNVVIPKQLNFKLIEPLLIKKMFANKSMATKEIMREFLSTRISEGHIIMSNPDVSFLTEHEIDAIAVGFVYQYQLNDALAG